MNNENVLVQVQDLCKHFKMDQHKVLHAVDHISFQIYKKETLGIVGESGCGKTTLGRTVLGLYPATSGKVLFDGLDVHNADKRQRKEFKKRAQIMLQDPYASLNPRMTVGDIIAEGLEAQKMALSKKEKDERVCNLLDLVGLSPEYRSRYPHEFSGGQRQRIGIARTLAVEPEFIVCDEPISALDVSIQAQVVNLFDDLQHDLDLTYLFIAHDLSMVRHISDRIGVMYLGNLVELGESRELYEHPAHPYTKALLSAIPSVDLDNPMSSRRIRLNGEVTSPINPKPGCRFAKRCKYAIPRCFEVQPDFKEVAPGHFVACHQIG
ncbi:oligopeptide/dipeptide ABC transporter ATP-binding protein [Lachnospiraceae bacterium 45-P1]